MHALKGRSENHIRRPANRHNGAGQHRVSGGHRNVKDTSSATKAGAKETNENPGRGSGDSSASHAPHRDVALLSEEAHQPSPADSSGASAGPDFSWADHSQTPAAGPPQGLLESSVRSVEKDPDGAMGDRPQHVASAVGALLSGNPEGAWSMPYLESTARQAWTQEYGAQQGLTAKDAPQDYLNSWVDAWSGGDTNIPLARDFNAELSRYGAKSPGASSPAAYDWRQTYGDNLSPPQRRSNDCGVTAAISMLRAAGYDADQEAVWQDATSKNFHDGDAWRGPGMMAEYLKSYGLQSHTEGLNWDTVNNQLGEGKPVILSTNAHYFVIQGRDPETGLYNVGSTGEALRNGSREMSAEQLANFSSGHTLVTLDSLQPQGAVREPAHAVAPNAQPNTYNPRTVVSGQTVAPGQKAVGAQGSPVNDQVAARMLPGAPQENIDNNLPLVLNALREQGMGDNTMALAALATIRAESSGFAPISEYISDYNTAPGGRPYGLYDFRQDLGNGAVGDGDRYKGRGFIQLTGKDNYRRYSELLGMGDALLQNPDLANDPDVAAKIMAMFLKDHEDVIRDSLQNGDYATARRAVNGGSHGLKEFQTAFEQGLAALA